MEKRNLNHITKLQIGDEVVTDPNMLQEQSNFYEYLYTSDSNISYDHGTEKEFFKSNQSKLSVIDAQ